MTIYQIQCLLGYLGYSPGPIDGVAGPKTQAAMARFRADYGLGEEGLLSAVAKTLPKLSSSLQVSSSSLQNAEEAEKYLQADGCYHIPRGVDVQLSKNFRSGEYHCQGHGCCSESIISKRLVETVQAIRDDVGLPVQIATAGGSGYRCSAHNSAVGGAANSLHKSGCAADLHCPDRNKLKAAVLRHITDGEIGTYSWGIHAGVWSRGYVSQFNGG